MEEGEEGKDGEFVPLSTHIIHIRARKDRDLSPLWQIEGITEGTREGGGRGGAASQIDRVITLFSSSETVETFSISLTPNAPRCSISNLGERGERGRDGEKGEACTTTM